MAVMASEHAELEAVSSGSPLGPHKAASQLMLSLVSRLLISTGRQSAFD